MQYWYEMDSKWGFADGSAYPAGIEIFRDVYIQTVNKLAEKHGSAVRVVPFDRGGCHNYCLWITVEKGWFEENYKGQPITSCPKAAKKDDAFEKAVEEAMEIGVDEFVIVDPKIDKEAFDLFLSDIK